MEMEIHSDQGRQFESQLFQELCHIWGVKKTRTSPYHPTANSVVERLNRTLGASLRALLVDRPQGDWDLLLPSIMRGIRATPHSTTAETPNYMMFGRELRLPDTITLEEPPREKTIVHEYAQQIKELMKESGERLRNQQYQIRQEETEEPNLYLKGDLVWLRNQHRKKGENPKLAVKYQGPYEVIEVLPYHTYRLRFNSKENIQHEDRIKLFVRGETVADEESVCREVDEQCHAESHTKLEEMIAEKVKWQPTTNKVQTRNQSQIWVTPKVDKVDPKQRGTIIQLEGNQPTNHTVEGAKEKEKSYGTTFRPTENIKQEPVDMVTEDLEDLVEVVDNDNTDSSGQSNQRRNTKTTVVDIHIDRPTTPQQSNSQSQLSSSSTQNPTTATDNTTLMKAKDIHSSQPHQNRRSDRMRGAPARLLDYSVTI